MRQGSPISFDVDSSRRLSGTESPPPEDALTRVLGVGSASMLLADIVFTGALILVFILVAVPIAYWIVRGIARSIRRR